MNELTSCKYSLPEHGLLHFYVFWFIGAPETFWWQTNWAPKRSCYSRCPISKSESCCLDSHFLQFELFKMAVKMEALIMKSSRCLNYVCIKFICIDLQIIFESLQLLLVEEELWVLILLFWPLGCVFQHNALFTPVWHIVFWRLRGCVLSLPLFWITYHLFALWWCFKTIENVIVSICKYIIIINWAFMCNWVVLAHYLKSSAKLLFPRTFFQVFKNMSYCTNYSRWWLIWRCVQQMLETPALRAMSKT